MIKKERFISTILIVTFSLIPLYVFSLINLIFFKSHLDFNHPKVSERISEEDIPQKIDALKRGYRPFFNPMSLRKYFVNSEIFPVGGLPYTDTYFCNEGYGLQTYKSDRFGLRNIDSNWDNIKDKGATFFIGDSYVHGACVEDKWTIPALSGKITGDNVLNIGAASNSPYEYIGAINGLVYPVIKEFPDKNFDIVLVFYDNDSVSYLKSIDILSGNAKKIMKKLPSGSIVPTKKYLNDINKVIKTNYPIDQEASLKLIKNPPKKTFKQYFLYKFITIMPIRQRIKDLITKTKKNKNAEIDPTTKSIKLLKDICSSGNNCNPYIIYIPGSKYWSRYPKSNTYRKTLKILSKKNNIRFIDGSKVIDSSSIVDYAIRGPHLSPKGYAKISEFYIKQSSKQISNNLDLK